MLRNTHCFVVASVVALAAQAAVAQSAGGIYVTPIPGAQFSGTVRVEETKIQPSGGTLQLWSERHIARDSTGRIYNEFRPLAPVGSPVVPPVTSVHLYDPQNRMSEMLSPLRKTYSVTVLARPPRTDTVDDFASASDSAEPASAFTHKEDLGYQTIAGLYAHGVRVTQTLPPARSGTGKEVVVVNEYWYSDALRLNLLSTHNDPRTGSVTTTVTQIDRSEPPAVMFGVPGDYTMR